MGAVQIATQSVTVSTLNATHGNEWHFDRLIYIAIAIAAVWVFVKFSKRKQ